MPLRSLYVAPIPISSISRMIYLFLGYQIHSCDDQSWYVPHPQSLGVIINNLPSLVKDSITREFLKNADLMWGLRVPFLADTAHLSPAYHLLFYISIRVAFRYFLTLGPLKLHAPFLYILYFPLFSTRLLQGWPLAVCLSVLCTTKVAFSLSVGHINNSLELYLSCI